LAIKRKHRGNVSTAQQLFVTITLTLSVRTMSFLVTTANAPRLMVQKLFLLSRA
jgi:hypothetical protein